MSTTSAVAICVSNFKQSITWFENVLGFRVVAREADEYAELAHGESSIQLAAESAPYWENERSRLLPPGQRGSGVEIILLVENVDAVYSQAQRAGANIVREPADYPRHMRQFWVCHPDGYLIRPAQKILSINPATYRSQITNAFRRDVSRITEELTKVKQVADRLTQQGDYLGAATIYEMLVTKIFDESHLYYEEEEENYYEEEPYYPEEEGLEEFVETCIEALGNALANELTDRVAREKCIEVLFNIYEQDLHADNSHGFTANVSDRLTQYLMPLERTTMAEQIHALLGNQDKKVPGSSLRRAYGEFLLALQKDTLNDDAVLNICRETGLTSDLINRLLTLGRIDEAEREIRSINDYSFLKYADLFIQHQQDAVAERLVRARITEKPDVQILEWLQKYYRARGNATAELEMSEQLFRTQPSLRRYQEVRDATMQLDRWQTLRSALLALLEESKNTRLLIEIALDEGDLDKALQRLKEMAKKDRYGTTYEGGYGYYDYGIDLKVAQAAVETQPREAILIYQQRAERLIAHRDRRNYQEACTYLVKVRPLYEKFGEREAWTKYIATLREQNRNLPALKDEMAKAKL